jgi:hypothetical protein|tara:strand:- start:1236 stop:1766 length:531 start_codon:yes stop_codon:yes gene_type:complete
MSGLLFLTTDDFNIQRGHKGSILCNSIKGFSLILFYSTQCEHCQNLIPIFKQLPGVVTGCQFGMINVSHNKQCVIISRETIAPITEVPYVIMYVNGKPFMRYKGPHDPKEISRFIVEVANNVQKNENFNKTTHIKENKKTGIPDYTTGKPLCGPDSKVCYLQFNNAYGDNSSQNRK